MKKEALDNGATEQSSAERLIEQAYNCLKELDAVSALHWLQDALKNDFEHPEVKYGLKCVNWWLDKIKKLDGFQGAYEKGVHVMSQWKSFHAFLDQIGQAGDSFDSCQYAFRCFAFKLALGFFQDVLTAAGNQPDPEVLLQTGRCYKGIGNYEEAAKYLEQAVRFRKEDSAALAELADVNALLEDPKAAKVLFREAFYLDPQAVDLSSMESKMITGLRQKVAELGYSGKELAEWIPVYGVLWGIFSVQRELKPVALGKLRQSILALESESGSGKDDFVKPRLLTRYFRLIDYCGSVRSGNPKDNSDVVEDTMRKIKIVDPAIYKQYRN
jgi:tetratricopeptide (TPR) repeat protein